MEFITVKHFYDSTELALARAKLELEGIKTITKDEQTSTVLGLEARAIGGTKLQVHEENYQKASTLMIELGFMAENDNIQDFLFIDMIDQIALKVPGINSLNKEMRLVSIGFVIIVIPFLIVVIMSL
jgi:hypothetical protein